nr:MAG TPA: hypothetical protein [Caudoviricetes sp.]
MQICHSLLVSTEFFKRFWLHDNRKRVRGSSGVQVPTFLLPWLRFISLNPLPQTSGIQIS